MLSQKRTNSINTPFVNAVGAKRAKKEIALGEEE
jgi:hypothetical protein